MSVSRLLYSPDCYFSFHCTFLHCVNNLACFALVVVVGFGPRFRAVEHNCLQQICITRKLLAPTPQLCRALKTPNRASIHILLRSHHLQQNSYYQ